MKVRIGRRRRTYGAAFAAGALLLGIAGSAGAGVAVENSVTVAASSVTEGDTGTSTLTFTVTRSTPMGTSSVDYATRNASATAGSDYASATGTLTFGEGETEKTVAVTVGGDTVSEPDEVFEFNLANASNATISDNQAIGEINNNDAPQLLYGAEAGPQGTSSLFLIDPGTGAATEIGPIGYAVSALALDPTTGVLYGITSPNSDHHDEDHEYALLAINRSTGAGTIVGTDSGGPDTYELMAADISFDASGQLYGWNEWVGDNLFRIDKATGESTLVGESELSTWGSGLAFDGEGLLWYAGSGAAGDIHVLDTATGLPTDAGTLDYADAQAINALDFACDNETLFGSYSADYGGTDIANQLIHVEEPNGASDPDAPAHVTVIGDSVDNLDALAFVCPGGFTITADQATVEEGANATFTVTRVGGAEGTVTVDYTTSDGTAGTGDYTETSGTLSFAHGEMSKTITVPTTDDRFDEDSETYSVMLSNPTGGANILSGSALGTINSGDASESGYRLVAADGGIFTFGDRGFWGSTGNIVLNEPVVGGATNLGNYEGYWLVAEDGGLFTFGNATFYGSMQSPGRVLDSVAVDIEPTPLGDGYWIVTANGLVHEFGAAEHFGDAGDINLNQPIIAMTITPTGKGYWLVGEDGGIFTFGDAEFYGSMGGTPLNAPIIDLGPTPDGKGYYLAAEDGGIFTFGTAIFRGSTGNMTLNAPVISMLVASNGNGYWMTAADGGVFTFGGLPFHGSTGAMVLNAPVLDMIN